MTANAVKDNAFADQKEILSNFMAFKKNIYISGPRMGTNNSMKGIELKKIKKVRKNASKKRS